MWHQTFHCLSASLIAKHILFSEMSGDEHRVHLGIDETLQNNTASLLFDWCNTIKRDVSVNILAVDVKLSRTSLYIIIALLEVPLSPLLLFSAVVFHCADSVRPTLTEASPVPLKQTSRTPVIHLKNFLFGAWAVIYYVNHCVSTVLQEAPGSDHPQGGDKGGVCYAQFCDSNLVSVLS